MATYQAASGGGVRGLQELAEGSRDILDDPRAEGTPGGRFGQPLSFNLVPEVGLQDEAGFTHEERKLVREPRRILGLPDLKVSATAVRVPVFDCHSEAAHLWLREPVPTASVEEALAATPGLRVYRRSENPSYPMPRRVFCPARGPGPGPRRPHTRRAGGRPGGGALGGRRQPVGGRLGRTQPGTALRRRGRGPPTPRSAVPGPHGPPGPAVPRRPRPVPRTATSWSARARRPPPRASGRADRDGRRRPGGADRSAPPGQPLFLSTR
ncbi:Asd/ArgC dimerization domain-containing protein [Streptomyces sp. NPDC086182]|uniref:Asd/ArgC dimerization domain-containing protein n=1 Tax=Streptomyces sp. NPDC086182 TaxID=3155058 RepID=UPI003420A217